MKLAIQILFKPSVITNRNGSVEWRNEQLGKQCAVSALAGLQRAHVSGTAEERMSPQVIFISAIAIVLSFAKQVDIRKKTCG